MFRRVGIALVVCVALSVVPAGVAAADRGPRRAPHPRPFPAAVAAKLQQGVALLQQTYNVPGLAFAVHEPGVGDFTRTVGAADLTTGRPVTEATHFRIGSVTKTFTATVILQLVAEHRLSLGEDVDRWLPQLPFAEQITIRDLLDMHSGVFDEGGPGSTLSTLALAHPTRVWRPREIVALAIADGSQPPGNFAYSDTNYVILGIIAGAVSGKPIERLVEERILRPLHLEHTSFPTTSMDMPTPAAGAYNVELVPGKGVNTTVALTLNPSVLGAAGAMISTLPDLVRWARALGSGELLPPRLQRLRLDLLPSTFEFGGLSGLAVDKLFKAGYGLGILGVVGYVGHNGIVNGFTSDVWFDPKTGTAIVVLVNAEVFVRTAPKTDTFLAVSDGLFMSAAEILAGKV